MANQYQDFLNELAAKNGVTVGETDLANLEGKNPEDVAQFQTDLTNQYAQRASNVPGGGGPEAGMGNPGVWGSVPAAFGETYSTPGRPSWLAGEYKPPAWQGGDFQAPTAADMFKDPGYQTRLDATQRGFERSAAAKGSVLSGGFIGRTLPRALGEEASNEYGNAFNRSFQTYQQKYGQYQDTVANSLNARGVNENAYQSDVGNSLSQYNTRYKGYLDAITNARNANLDFWNQNQDVVQNGLQASGLARPPV